MSILNHLTQKIDTILHVFEPYLSVVGETRTGEEHLHGLSGAVQAKAHIWKPGILGLTLENLKKNHKNGENKSRVLKIWQIMEKKVEEKR